jgi:hypothetical protein
MRGFLFDENLPRVPSLQARLPVTHALDLGTRPTDSQLLALIPVLSTCSC